MKKCTVFKVYIYVIYLFVTFKFHRDTLHMKQTRYFGDNKIAMAENTEVIIICQKYILEIISPKFCMYYFYMYMDKV